MQFFTEIKPVEEPLSQKAFQSFRETSSLIVTFCTLAFQLQLVSSYVQMNPMILYCFACPTSLMTGCFYTSILDRAHNSLKNVQMFKYFQRIENVEKD